MAKSTIVLLILMGLLSLRGIGSPQMPDYIIVGRDTIATYHLLLEDYFRKSGAANKGELFGLAFRDPSHPNPLDVLAGSFNCWRGYQAIYQIRGDSLFLVYIISCGELKKGSIDTASSSWRMRKLFGEQYSSTGVLISWFSGEISYPLPSPVLRWDGVFYKIYEKETVLEVEEGKIVRKTPVDNYQDVPGGINRRDKSKLPSILFRQLKKFNWKKTGACDCSDTYAITIDTFGYVSRVTTPDYSPDASDSAEHQFCINTVQRLLEPLRFDILQDKGRPIAEDVYVEIWVNDRGKLENWRD